MKKAFCFYFFIFYALSASATHNRAGEITYRQLADLTYEFTITTYTRDSTSVDRPNLTVSWGDNTSTDVNRLYKKYRIGPDIDENKYIATHTFPGPSIYKVSFEDPNRNLGVNNVPNSIDIPFYVETVLIINPFLGYNNSPVLKQPPIDAGCVNYPFFHNPGAYDPDGTDSLSYRLVKCKGDLGKDIPGYIYPEGKRFTLNARTGDLVWDSPQVTGEYNVAFIIEEWRNGQLIGSVERDMQIRIGMCDTAPPKLDPIPEICVVAGSPIQFDVIGRGPKFHYLYLSASGAPLEFSNPASFKRDSAYALVKGTFAWNTQCVNISRLPQWMVFKVNDIRNKENLVDIKSVPIRILGPSPKNFSLVPVGNSIVMKWDKNLCKEAIGYRIYKRIGMYSGTIQCPCNTGVPAPTGYALIATLDGYDTTTFTYDDNNNGLAPGTQYCYMVTAVFKDGAESCPSNQQCAVLKRDLPIITNVSITKTDALTGQVYVAWSKPTELDTSLYKGPFTYVVTQSIAGNPGLFVPLDSTGLLKGLNDTLISLKNINTNDLQHFYQIRFYGYLNGKRQFIGKTQVAASVYLSIAPTDNTLMLSWKAAVPWLNTKYIIYRLNPKTAQYDSIGTSNQPGFTNTGLKNGLSYCYKVKTIGAYSASGLVKPIVNYSQESCQQPVDNTNPCAPDVTILPDCRLHKNLLTWNNTNKSCSNDVLKYNVYYSPLINGKMNLLTSTSLATDTFYLNDNLESIAGCYLVTASDSGKNESLNGTPVCVDNCPSYELPNIFTPNGDNYNDAFRPFPYAYIKDIEMTIYDRWGVPVYKTTDPDVKWDGKNQSVNKECVEGVYFYICDVHEIHVDGIHTRTLKGFVSLIKGKATQQGN